MNYVDLKDLIRYLKELVTCTNCKKKFFNKDISILAILPTEGVFQLNCHNCEHTMLVNIGMKNHFHPKTNITNRDVLSMQKFLEEFNGDFKKLFKSSK